WKSAGKTTETPGYESETIERFLTSRSNSVTSKVAKMLQLDVALKLLVALVLIIDAVIYFNIQKMVLVTCAAGLVLIIPLVLFEFRVLKRFSEISDYAQTTREKLSAMLTFLRSRFFTALLSISATYIFVFISGSLLYFYSVYGKVRAMDGMDVFVFSVFIIIGIAMNFFVNQGQVKYNIKHLEMCLSDLNEQILEAVTSNIELQQKQDRITKILLMLVIVFGFVIFAVVLKKFGI
ncbi:MAG TPA: hypothetical protein VKA38_06665, partial [Draconibacterium sp.]|nr:hypothetical protein [Draconibacterium sp.]